jgi:hypothetical protein
VPLLFSYGTLQQESVQLATFARLLDGQRDELPGYEPSLVTIEDPQVVVALGRTHHQNVTFNGSGESRVRGTVFELTDAELAAADAFERSFSYVRIAATLASGKRAWLYVDSAGGSVIDLNEMRDFATRYTAAWCSQDAARVASFFAKDGSLKINDGVPSVGRAAITADAQGFMSAFPDMVVAMDDLFAQGDRFVYRWTLTGRNTGPGGGGKSVRISGYEEWTMNGDGLIRASLGHFDEAEYRRQLQVGVGASGQ